VGRSAGFSRSRWRSSMTGRWRAAPTRSATPRPRGTRPGTVIWTAGLSRFGRCSRLPSSWRCAPTRSATPRPRGTRPGTVIWTAGILPAWACAGLKPAAEPHAPQPSPLQVAERSSRSLRSRLSPRSQGVMVHKQEGEGRLPPLSLTFRRLAVYFGRYSAAQAMSSSCSLGRPGLPVSGSQPIMP